MMKYRKLLMLLAVLASSVSCSTLSDSQPLLPEHYRCVIVVEKDLVHCFPIGMPGVPEKERPITDDPRTREYDSITGWILYDPEDHKKKERYINELRIKCAN